MDRERHTQLMRDISTSIDDMERMVREGFNNDYTPVKKQQRLQEFEWKHERLRFEQHRINKIIEFMRENINQS